MCFIKIFQLRGITHKQGGECTVTVGVYVMRDLEVSVSTLKFTAAASCSRRAFAQPESKWLQKRRHFVYAQTFGPYMHA